MTQSSIVRLGNQEQQDLQSKVPTLMLYLKAGTAIINKNLLRF